MNSTICSPRQRWRDVLEVHPAADEYPPMTDGELRELADDIKVRGLQQHIILFRDADGNELLLDGRHRLDAIELAGFTLVAGGKFDRTLGLTAGCRVRVVTGVDPCELAASLNAHRRHLTAEQRQERLIALIAKAPEKSDRQIAKDAGFDHKTVGRARTRGEDVGRIPHVEKRTDTRGRRQPAVKVVAGTEAKVKKPAKPKPGTTTPLSDVCSIRGVQASLRARLPKKDRHEIALAECKRLVGRLIEVDRDVARILYELLASDAEIANAIVEDLATALGIKAA
jgi:ParB-like chromosome segregation protein Spo0J